MSDDSRKSDNTSKQSKSICADTAMDECTDRLVAEETTYGYPRSHYVPTGQRRWTS